MQYNFEWDIGKAKSNIRKHRISFEQAATVFTDPRAISIYDDEHSKTEDRWITLGLTSNGVLVVVHHTFSQLDNNAIIRIISSRKATKREAGAYREGGTL